MKTVNFSALMAAGVLGLAVQDSSAAFINGAISISAPVTPNSLDLSAATLLDVDEANAYIVPGSKLGDFTTATAVMSFVSSFAINPAGAGLPGLIYTLDNGISLWLTSLTEISNDSNHIALDGDGVFMRPGYDDTFGDFDITVVKSVSTGGTFVSFNFATTSAVEGAVPDGGASAMLLGLGVMGLAAFRRKS